MTDIANDKKKIQQQGSQFRGSVDERTFERMGASLNYLDDAVAYVIDNLPPLGVITMADLTEEQFQDQNESFTPQGGSVKQEWVLADGRDVTGSRYAVLTGNTTVPNHVDRYARMANNDGELRAQQADSFDSHDHGATFVINAAGTNVVGSNDTNDAAAKNFTSGKQNRQSNLAAATFDFTIANSGGIETRPKTTKTYFFIRIN